MFWGAEVAAMPLDQLTASLIQRFPGCFLQSLVQFITYVQNSVTSTASVLQRWLFSKALCHASTGFHCS